MCAARPLPDTDWTILISPGGTVPPANQGMKIGPTDNILFHNTAGFPVGIVFTNVFPHINNLANGQYSAAMGNNSPGLNVTVNYTIYNAVNNQPVSGPYSVQFGIGPLPISISALNTNPGVIAVPNGGQIQFTADVSYTVSWESGGQPAPGMWSPQPTVINPGLNTPPQVATPAANSKALTYLVVIKTVKTRGSGTVKVGS